MKRTVQFNLDKENSIFNILMKPNSQLRRRFDIDSTTNHQNLSHNHGRLIRSHESDGIGDVPDIGYPADGISGGRFLLHLLGRFSGNARVDKDVGVDATGTHCVDSDA